MARQLLRALVPALLLSTTLTATAGVPRAGPPVNCGSLYPVLVQMTTVGCTHGPDPFPGQSSEPEPVVAADLSKPRVPCYGDGTSGPRVQAIYAYPADKPDRYTQVAPSIATWAAQMDQVFDDSAQQTGGIRHVRFVTDANCNLVVLKVKLTSTGDDTFGNTMTELRAMGMDRTDRRYLVWMDSTVLCGIAGYYIDDRPGSTNANDGSMPGSVARVDSGCWGLADEGQSVEAHELLHTLGGVQPTAPNATPLGHCTDGADRMCYDDGSGLQQRTVCPAQNQAFLDCQHNDYYSTNPKPGSYLATHWDTADSEFLAIVDPPTVTPPPAPMPSGSPGPASSPPASLLPTVPRPGPLGGASSRLQAVAPHRLLRPTRMAPNSRRDVVVAGRGGVPTSNVDAAVLAVTVGRATSSGGLAVVASGATSPDEPSLKFAKGKPRSAVVVAPLGSDGSVSLVNQSPGSMHVRMSVEGWFDASGNQATGQVTAVRAGRIVDTRAGIGGPRGRMKPGATRRVVVTGRHGVPTSGVSGVWLDLVASHATGHGRLTVYPAGHKRPSTSALDYTSRRTVSTLVLATVGRRGAVLIHNRGARTDLTATVVGWVDNGSNAADDRYRAVTPATLYAARHVGAGDRRRVQVTGRGGVPSSGVRAVMVQVEADRPTGDGSVAIWPSGHKPSFPSTVKYWRRSGAAQTALVAIGKKGRITLVNHAAGTGLRITIVGYFA
jgi:hypothetical protein